MRGYLVCYFTVRGESNINFRTERVIMAIAGGGVIANDILKMRKVTKFQNLCSATAHLYR